MTENDRSLIELIISHCEKIAEYISECHTFDRFFGNELLQDGVTVRLIYIGNLITDLSEDFKASYQGKIDLSIYEKLRDNCLNKVENIDYQAVWNVATNNVPELNILFKSII